MKKTKMRKKMLLSSIAMLMVATVSLGSATFAWFKSSPDATAEGFSMKATASNGLKVLSQTEVTADAGATFSLTDTTTFKSSTILRAIKDVDSTIKTNPASISLNPVSLYAQDDSMAAFSVLAAADNSYAADGTAAVTSATGAVTNNANTATGDYYEEDIYTALVGAANDTDEATMKIKGLTITTATPMASGAHIAIYYDNWDGSAYTSKLIGIYGTTANNSAKVITAIGTPTNTYDNASTTTYEVKAQTTAANTELGGVDVTGKDKVRVVVYLDGEDSTVKSSNIRLADIISNIKLDLTIA